MKQTIITTTLALASLPAFAGSSVAVPEQAVITAPESSPWRVQLDIYGWAEGLDGDIGIGALSAPVDIGFDDILSNLDIAAMGAVEIGYGRWSAQADLIYAKIGGDTSVLSGRIPLDFEEKQFLGNFTLGYQLLDGGGTRFGVYAGARMNHIDVELSSNSFLQLSSNVTWVDPIIGARIQQELSEKFFVRAVGDVGGFGVSSDFTWQAMAGVGWNVMDGGSLLLGYRGIGTDYSSGKFSYDVVAHGPIIGFEYKF